MAGLEAASAAGRNAQPLLESSSPAMRQAVSLARQTAETDATILIRGESGIGKGVLAKAVHAWSHRASRPFAVVSAPALSPALLESELFGHLKGAFTGAIRDNPGRLAAADGGTLFLDEIGDLPLSLQPKLLRFAQDREYERVGETRTRVADVRLITATNVDLASAVREKRFREDLLYRINVVEIVLPPLRDHAGDVLPLAAEFLRELNAGRGPIDGFAPGAVAALMAYRWPGNVRELRNVVERAVILCHEDQIDVRHLPDVLTMVEGSGGPVSSIALPDLGDSVPLATIEEIHIRRVLARTRSLDEAAAILDIDAATFWRRRKKYGI